MFDVIVIGGGPSGSAALRARELGAKVALVERGQWAGLVQMTAARRPRVLAKTAARLLRDTGKFDEYGLEGERPALNWERLLVRTQYVVNALHEKKQLLGHLQASGVETYIGVGDARFSDAHTLTVGRAGARRACKGKNS